VVIASVLVAAVGAGAWFWVKPAGSAAPGAGAPGGGGRGGGAFRPTMTVDVATVGRAPVAERITVVGNLIGAATVDVVPKVGGRLESVAVRLGDPVAKGQLLAQVEDRELREQLRQTEASMDVSRATIRQREADLKNAQTSLARSKNLFDRNLIARQALDDAEARFDAAVAQVDLAKAQATQSQARLDELRINLSNTRIVSPVDGFVGSRRLDPGAFVGTNSAFMSVVDIHLVRLVANLVERDLSRVGTGMEATVNVDAYPGETFKGRVARLAPVLDPATRTAEMEVEVPNPGSRLKPGMYARVEFVVKQRQDAIVVPRNALVDVEGKRGVFVADGATARFRPVQVGILEQDVAEVLSGVAEGDRVVTIGSAALKDGDPIVVAGAGGGPGGPRGSGGRAGGGTKTP
jgi:RND family efflux transporter MFP subunit